MNILKKNLNSDEIIGIGLFILSIVLMLIMLILGLNQALWNDETFTFQLISMSFKNMLSATAVDVHPPLYYMILMAIFKLFHLHPLSNIILSKLISTIPLMLLICFSFVILRKEFGWLVGGVFAFCIVAMPKLMFYGIQIRMYTWVMLFVTLSFYYCYIITKESTKKNWIIFTIFSLLAAYTHYFGTIAVGMIYLMLLFYLVLKNRNLIRNWILSAIFTLLIFIPWFIYAFHQTKYLTSKQWHIPVNEEMFKSIGILFSPVNIMYDYSLTNLGLLLLMSVILLIVFYCLFKIINDKDYSFSFIGLGGVFVLISTMTFAYLFSILSSPMLMARYSFPMAGCLWLSVSVLLSQLYSKKVIFIPILAVILLLGMTNCVSFINYEHDVNQGDLEFRHYLNQISVKDMVLVLSTQFDADFFRFYLNKNDVVVGYDNFLLHYNAENLSKKGEIWVFDNWGKNTDGTKGFNNSLNQKGFKLDDVVEIDQIYGNYPHNIYLINSIE
ncbi:MAG: glycosyltransferase family 39 protein [Methanobrevibacter sp.]|jgi:uncharacterized membrane protein|nr:glycosyltransferase family 39 protein [Candidatus Methanovirga australis]